MNLMLKNCLKNSFIKFKLSKNDQLGVVRQICTERSHFRGPTDFQIIFSHTPWLHLDHNFFDQKSAKLVETQKFCFQRLNHSFLHRVSYSHFLI